MNSIDELRNIIMSELTNNNIEEGWENECAERIIAGLGAARYVKYDKIEIDPKSLIVLLVDMLNKFREQRPFIIVEETPKGEKDGEDDKK